MALSNNNKVFHSPAWYYTKTKDEYFTSPLVKTMLQNDAGDMWDNKATDEENITFYEELWNDEIAFFEYHGQQDVYEILLKDMKELDIIAYNELKGEIESSETYYVRVGSTQNLGRKLTHNFPSFVNTANDKRDAKTRSASRIPNEGAG